MILQYYYIIIQRSNAQFEIAERNNSKEEYQLNKDAIRDIYQINSQYMTKNQHKLAIWNIKHNKDAIRNI